ncbi:kelch-like protein 32 isoform X1 [Lates japonicus]|uniref:Kelch-like protein 32 isoform X1 n=1 Tax=Lates japonicus TaxID=270547 RepID=A0AAD3M7M9_LATJO|nr:kelch-like protein 32 isoform X1 [Lates japonicus]
MRLMYVPSEETTVLRSHIAPPLHLHHHLSFLCPGACRLNPASGRWCGPSMHTVQGDADRTALWAWNFCSPATRVTSHKAVLAACSDYFRAMFSLCMVESEADEVTLQGVTSVGLKHALDFAYTGQILLEPAVIQDVLSAGSHLQLLELLSLCSHYLIQELSSVNYLELYRVADLFHLPALEEAVVGFLVEHLSELSQSRQDEALQLPYRLLREVLKSDRLTSLSEEEIWKLVVLWLEHDCHTSTLRIFYHNMSAIWLDGRPTLHTRSQ